MGGLLSTTPEPPPQQHHYFNTAQYAEADRRAALARQLERMRLNERNENLNRANIVRHSYPAPVVRQKPVPLSVPKLIQLDIHHFGRNQPINERYDEVLRYTDLDECDCDFIRIKRMITNKRFIVEGIKKVHNFLLENAYNLKKIEKQKHSLIVKEKWLFHGTSRDRLESICEKNFNWRLHGTNRGHRYGHGVSFSPNAIYASNYPNNFDVRKKVMIVAKVLVAAACPGDVTMTLPLDGYDATMKGDGIVVVKYDDHEFFPAFVISYHLERDPNKTAPNTGYRGKNRFKKNVPIYNPSDYVFD